MTHQLSRVVTGQHEKGNFHPRDRGRWSQTAARLGPLSELAGGGVLANDTEPDLSIQQHRSATRLRIF